MKGLQNYTIQRATKVFTAGVFLLTLASCGKTKTDAEYLASAKKHFQQGDTQSYIIELKNAIQTNPKNAEARYLMGKVHLSFQQGASAQKEFEKAIDSGMPAAELVDELAQAYFDQYQFKTLLDNTIDFSALSAKEKAKSLFLRGVSNLRLRQVKDAQADFDAAVVLDTPKYSQLSKAYLEALQENFERAKSIVDPLLELDPAFVEAHVLASRIHVSLHNLEQAITHFEKAKELEPNRLQHQIELAKLYAFNNDFDNAERTIARVLELVPQHLPSNLIMAGIKLEKKEWEEAKSHADAVIKISEVNRQAKLISGIANFHLQNYEIARDRLMSVTGFLKPQHLAHRMLAYANFKLGYSKNADSILESIGDPQGKDAPLLSEFGSILAQRGDYAEAETLLSKAAEINPDDTKSLTRLGVIKLQQDDLSGIADLQSVLDKDKDSFWARTALVQHYIQTKNYDIAKKLANELIESKPKENEGYLLLARVHFYEKNLSESLKILNQALEFDPTNFALKMSSAKVLIAQKNYEKAKNALLDILQNNPGEQSTLITLYRVEKKTNETKKSTDRIEKLVKSNPEDDKYKLIYALILADSQKVQEALDVLNKIKEDSDHFERAQIAMGNLNSLQGKHEIASQHYQRLIRSSPKEIKNYNLLAQSYMRGQKPEKALETIKKALEIFSDNPSLQLSEIELLFAVDRDEQAKSKIARFSALNGPTPRLEFINGRYYVKRGEFNAALPHFKTLHILEPSTRSTIALAEVYKKLGDLEQSRVHLEKWLQDNPEDQAAKMFLANLMLAKDNSKAIKNYRELLQQKPNNAVVLNNLAWALGESGDLTEALEYASKAYEIAAIPAIADTYGLLLLKKGEKEEALEKLKMAFSKMSADPTVAYHLALALEANNRPGEAFELLKQIKNNDFAEKKEAESLYKSLSSNR